MFSGFSAGHLLVVALVALVVLGPRELPKVIRACSRLRRDLGMMRARLEDEMRDLVGEHDVAPSGEATGRDSTRH